MTGNKAEPNQKKNKLFGLWNVIDDEASAIKAALSIQFVAFYITFGYTVNLGFLLGTGKAIFSPKPSDEFEFYVQMGLMVAAIAVSLWLGFKIRSKSFSVIPAVFIWLIVEIILKSLSAPGEGILMAIILVVISIYGFRGWLALRKYTIDEPTKTKKNWWLIILGSIVSIVILFVVALGTLLEIGILPETKVIVGKDIPNYQLETLVDKSIVNPSDSIEFLYCEGFFSVLEGGQLLTDNRLISYEQTDGKLSIYEMPYESISKIELLQVGSSYEDSVYKIYGNQNADWEYIVILLSVEEGGDLAFINKLSEKIKQPKYN
ncbi:MAG: hypothetical protein V7723_07455 [Sneathiella sp.]|uniref:hypothetical protein n=1 Tax=Sneathiella sp. TaxID=1964365 RepID=UPI0030024328